MKLKASAAGLSRLEHGLAPPMRSAITIPVVAEAGARGMDVTIYVCVGSFQRGLPTSDNELRAIASEVFARLSKEGA